MRRFAPANGTVVGRMTTGHGVDRCGDLVIHDDQLWWITDDHYGCRIPFNQVQHMMANHRGTLRSTRIVANGHCVIAVESDVYDSISVSIHGSAELDDGAVTADCVEAATVDLWRITAYVAGMAVVEDDWLVDGD